METWEEDEEEEDCGDDVGLRHFQSFQRSVNEILGEEEMERFVCGGGGLWGFYRRVNVRAE